MSLRTPLLFAAVASLAVACAPKAPRITPRSAEIRGATGAGLQMRIHLTAHNPNGVGLTVRSLDVRVFLAGRDLGVSRVTRPTPLPPRQDVNVDGDVSVPWGDLPSLLMATALNEQIPYRLEGNARVGGERLNVEVPFRMESTMPRSVLTGAASNSVPGMPPIRWAH
jgi:LEA14-like dessication related protein